MFSKFMKFFEVKEDNTLDYMNPDKLLKNKNRILKDPLNQEEEDAFFRQLEEEHLFEPQEMHQEPHSEPKQNVSRESTLEKMRQCMKERDWNPKHYPKIIIGGVCLLISIGILAIALHETPNPLIGKWRPQGKNVFAPASDIEFTKDKVQVMGITTMIKYDIDSAKINVIDTATKTGIIFYITGDKTVETNLLGVKTTYRKVDK